MNSCEACERCATTRRSCEEDAVGSAEEDEVSAAAAGSENVTSCPHRGWKDNPADGGGGGSSDDILGL